MFRSIEGNSQLCEAIVNNAMRIGNVRVYKGTFYSLRNRETMNLRFFRRKVVIRKFVYKRIVRV